MIRRIIHTALLLNIWFASYGQELNSLTFSFSSNFHQYKMEKLNDFLLDTNYYNSIYFNYDSPPENTVNRGRSFKALISYQFLNFVDLGVYSSYQNGEITRYPRFDMVLWSDTVSYAGEYNLKTSAFSFGINSTFYVNKLLKFSEKSRALKRLLIGLEINGGIGYSKMVDLVSYDGLTEFSLYNYSATNFQSEVALNIGFIVTKSKIWSSIGIKGGYQFFKTSNVRNSYGDELYGTSASLSGGGGKTVNLDFSGYFFGFFVKIGK